MSPELGPDQLYDAAPCGFLSTTVDGVVVRANRTLLRWIGREREQVEGRPFPELLMPGSLLFFETHFRELLHLTSRVDGLALDLLGADGEPLPVLLSAERPADGDLVHVSLFSARERAGFERQLRRRREAAERSEARLRLLTEVREACRSALGPSEVSTRLAQALSRATRGGSVSVWLLDRADRFVLQPGGEQPFVPRVLTAAGGCPAALALAGGRAVAVPPDRLRREWPELVGPLTEAGRESLLVAPLLAEDTVLGVVQVALRRDRPVPPEELSLLGAVGQEAGRALLRCTLPEDLRGPPFRDAVTGTATSALFVERVGDALAEARAVAVLLADIAPEPDGPPVDDRVMAELGRRLRVLSPEPHSTARVGPQRLALLLTDQSPAEVRAGAERLQLSLTDPLPLQVPVTVTVGAAVHDPASEDAPTSASLLSWAVGALEEAGARGPGRRVVRGAASRAAARALVDAERTVRRALAGDGLRMHYQPIVQLRTGRVLAVEALCRLRLPDGTLLHPAHFIDAAEASGLVVPLGRQVLRLACAQQQRWSAEGIEVDVAVNVAASQAAEPGFATEVLSILDETGCPSHRLVLELTESALLAATSEALSSFERVRENGVRVALDDFGTRYASLDYVRSFPLDELKIDQSFVAGLPGNHVAAVLVRMVAQLAVDLGLLCVAEGIETTAQAVFLRDLGVLGQGFAVGVPGPPEDLVQRVAPALWLQAAGAAGDSA